MSKTIAFVMDPLERIKPAGDTSFALMLEAQKRGFEVLYAAPGTLGNIGGECTLRGIPMKVTDQPKDFYVAGELRQVWARDCAAIIIRTDPPFDDAYLTATWLLSFAEDAGVRVINSPRGIRSANEKDRAQRTV